MDQVEGKPPQFQPCVFDDGLVTVAAEVNVAEIVLEQD